MNCFTCTGYRGSQRSQTKKLAPLKVFHHPLEVNRPPTPFPFHNPQKDRRVCNEQNNTSSEKTELNTTGLWKNPQSANVHNDPIIETTETGNIQLSKYTGATGKDVAEMMPWLKTD